MNTVVTKQKDKVLLDFISEKSPSPHDKRLILFTLDSSNSLGLDYDIWTIPDNDRNRAFKFEGQNKTIEEFINEFLKICDGKRLFRLTLYLK